MKFWTLAQGVKKTWKHKCQEHFHLIRNSSYLRILCFLFVSSRCGCCYCIRSGLGWNSWCWSNAWQSLPLHNVNRMLGCFYFPWRFLLLGHCWKKMIKPPVMLRYRSCPILSQCRTTIVHVFRVGANLVFGPTESDQLIFSNWFHSGSWYNPLIVLATPLLTFVGLNLFSSGSTNLHCQYWWISKAFSE